MGVTDKDRITAIQAIGKRWTDLILDLETGPAKMTGDLSVITVTKTMQFWAHPLLTEQNVRDLSVGLSAALRSLEQYECFGTWDDEHDDAMSGRTEYERLDLLRQDLNICTYRLWAAAEPCVSCVRTIPTLTLWQPQTHGALCGRHHATVQQGKHLVAVAS